jgi:hypothetical protein
MINPIFAQALAPWAPPSDFAPTPMDLVTRALILGLTSPDAARAQECADLAEHWAQGLTDAEVERCKEEAMRYTT